MFVLTAAMSALSTVGGILTTAVGAIGTGLGTAAGAVGSGLSTVGTGIAGLSAGQIATGISTVGALGAEIAGAAQAGDLASAQLDELAFQQSQAATDMENERKRVAASLLASEPAFLGGANYELLGQVEAVNVENLHLLGRESDIRRRQIEEERSAARRVSAGNILGTAASGVGDFFSVGASKSKKKKTRQTQEV